jgi:hypothetical protein
MTNSDIHDRLMAEASTIDSSPAGVKAMMKAHGLSYHEACCRIAKQIGAAVMLAKAARRAARTA